MEENHRNNVCVGASTGGTHAHIHTCTTTQSSARSGAPTDTRIPTRKQRCYILTFLPGHCAGWPREGIEGGRQPGNLQVVIPLVLLQFVAESTYTSSGANVRSALNPQVSGAAWEAAAGTDFVRSGTNGEWRGSIFLTRLSYPLFFPSSIYSYSESWNCWNRAFNKS